MILSPCGLIIRGARVVPIRTVDVVRMFFNSYDSVDDDEAGCECCEEGRREDEKQVEQSGQGK